MIKLDENFKSEAQLKLAEKLERDRQKLQEQIKKDHRQALEMKKKAKALIGDLFAEHLPDFYNFEAAELKEIIDTAMTQKATEKRIAAIRKAAGIEEEPAESEPEVGTTEENTDTVSGADDGEESAETVVDDGDSDIAEGGDPGDYNEETVASDSVDSPYDSGNVKG